MTVISHSIMERSAEHQAHGGAAAGVSAGAEALLAVR
ncbi:MAG: hypothetical protein JWM30_1639, partial [Burkholderia sp.]|nr:hypothetical protein [Burkholderia sp.]